MDSTNIMESMDIEEKAACNERNTDSVDNLEQKMKNIDQKNIASSVKYMKIAQNLASFFENLTTEENCGKKRENSGNEERPTSSVEIIDEKNPASNAENIDVEENSVNPEEENAYDMESNYMKEVADNIAIFKSSLSAFKKDIENLFEENCNMRKSFSAANFSQDVLLSEKGQRLNALLKKKDSCILAIKHELKYWDDINDLTNEDLITFIVNRSENGENPFTRIAKEGENLMNISTLIKKLSTINV